MKRIFLTLILILIFESGECAQWPVSTHTDSVLWIGTGGFNTNVVTFDNGSIINQISQDSSIVPALCGEIVQHRDLYMDNHTFTYPTKFHNKKTIPTYGFQHLFSQQWNPFAIVDTTTPNLTYQQDASTDVAPDGTLGVVWQELTTDRRNPIVFVKSTDQGHTFQKSFVIDSILRNRTQFEPGEERYVHEFKFGPDGTIWVLWSHYLIYDYYDVAYLRLSKSTDRGQTFTQVFNNVRWSTTFIPRLAVARDSSVYVLWDDSQFKCTRFFNGDINQRTDAEIPNGWYIIDSRATIAVDSSLNVYSVWNGFWYDTGYHFYIFSSVSRDSGKSFDSTRVDLGSEPELAVNNSQHVFILYKHITENGTLTYYLSVSSDGGNNFTPKIFTDSLDGFDNPSIIYNRKSDLLVSWTYGGNIYFSRSTDFGNMFTEAVAVDRSRLARGPEMSADTSGNVFLFANAGIRTNSTNGIYFSKTNVLVEVDDKVASIPIQWKLYQNYPNPFNPTTIIRYELPQKSRVDIKIYDLLGREIQTLVDEIQEAGTKLVQFHARDLPSGAYFYRITTSRFSNLKKMLLIR